MSKTYVPESVIFNGVEYVGKTYHDVPEELAEVIAKHPQWSKATPPKPVDKYKHLRSQNLAYLKGQLEAFEADINQRQKQLDIHNMMGSTAPKQWLVNQERVTRDYQELKAYVEPLIKQRELEELARRARIVERATDRGSVITFDKDGNYSEFFPTNTIKIGGRV